MAAGVTRGSVLRYRALAYITGVFLVILVFVGIPLELGGHNQIVAVVGLVHGYLFPVYVLFTFLLARQARWTVPRTLLIALAGTIPFASFFAERNVVHELEARGLVPSTTDLDPGANGEPDDASRQDG